MSQRRANKIASDQTKKRCRDPSLNDRSAVPRVRVPSAAPAAARRMHPHCDVAVAPSDGEDADPSADALFGAMVKLRRATRAAEAAAEAELMPAADGEVTPRRPRFCFVAGSGCDNVAGRAEVDSQNSDEVVVFDDDGLFATS
jgi:hypothetical protein